jgi:23S rRNA-intervening sequence protein
MKQVKVEVAKKAEVKAKDESRFRLRLRVTRPEPKPNPQPMTVYSSFEDMPVWQKGMELAERIFTLTETLPNKEDHGLTSLELIANIWEELNKLINSFTRD